MSTKHFKDEEFACKCGRCSGKLDKLQPRLLFALEFVRNRYGRPMYVASGLRCEYHNMMVHGAKGSAHLEGQAADIADPDGSLMKWVLGNLDLMQQWGLWIEDFRWTYGWVHFQIRPAPARIFIPQAGPPPYPHRWSGHYDRKYDQAS